MSLYNRTLIVIFIFCFGFSIAHAEEGKATSFSTVGLSYVSWVELMTLDNGSIVDDAFATFYGTALSYDHENYVNRWGTVFSASALFGQANGGGTQTLVTYQKSYQSWMAGKLDYKFAYRASQPISIAAGPFIIYRSISWDKMNLQSVKSGADLNVGALLELRLRLTPNWELQQSFGTMFFKANTIWSFGVGYKF